MNNPHGNEWLILYDDGHTPANYAKLITAATADEAIKISGLDSGLIWLVVLKSCIATAHSLLQGLNKGQGDWLKGVCEESDRRYVTSMELKANKK